MIALSLPPFCTAATADFRPTGSLNGWHGRLVDDPAALAALATSGRRADDFWVRPAVLAYLAEHPQGVSTSVLLLEHAPTDRRLLLTVQYFYFNAAGQVRDEAKGETSGFDLRRRLLAPFSFRVAAVGQFVTSGPFATLGLEELADAEATELLPAVGDFLMGREHACVAYLLKDLYAADHPVTRGLEKRRHYSLPDDPIMQLTISPEWRTMEDYLEALTSKYRVRYRRARGKLAGLTRRRLTSAEVRERAPELFDLYRGLSATAGFNVVKLKPGYFSWLAGLTDATGRPSVVFHGYFTAPGELVGFTTAIANGPVRHAHFLGLRSAYKRSHHLYHNMLFDLLADALAAGASTLDYGRTALEIKSSVGARPVDSTVLLHSRYATLNFLIPYFTPAVYTAEAWSARNPFRETSAD